MAFPNLATTIMVSLILWLGVGSSTGAPPQVASFGVQEAAVEQVNDPELVARVMVLVAEAYHLAGFSEEEKNLLLDRWATTNGLSEPADPLNGETVIFGLHWSPKMLVVRDALEFAGLLPEDAAMISEWLDYGGVSGATASVPGAAGSVLMGDDLCLFYPITIIYCTVDAYGSVHKRKKTGFINGACWEAIGLCPATGTCALGELHWLNLTISGSCEGLLPAGKCVWVRSTGSGEWKDCFLEGRVECTCFNETWPLPVNCANISWTCGDPITGPTGCPCP